MEQQSYLCRLRHFLGTILLHHLGPACMQALANVTLGLEGLERLQYVQGMDGADPGPTTRSTLAQGHMVGADKRSGDLAPSKS